MTSAAWEAIGFASPWILAAAVIAWIVYWDYRKKVLDREERAAMIERGVAPPPPMPAGWPGVKARELELKYMERRLRIEKGLDVVPDPALGDVLPKLKPRDPKHSLRHGLVGVCAGLALGISYLVVRFGNGPTPSEAADWLLALAILCPLATLFGVAQILFYSLTRHRPGEGVTEGGGRP